MSISLFSEIKRANKKTYVLDAAEVEVGGAGVQRGQRVDEQRALLRRGEGGVVLFEQVAGDLAEDELDLVELELDLVQHLVQDEPT